MSRVRWLAVIATATVAACGGGGGDSPTAAKDELDPNTAAVMLAVGMYDAIAGPERMMALANADAQLAGAAGAPVVTQCNTGSVSTRKTGAATFELVANDCQLSASDGLVYDGTWLFTVTSTTFAADGSCPAATACQVQATLDVSSARFGYGTATEQVVGGMYQADTSAAGVHTANVLVAGFGISVEDVGTVIVNGNTAAFTLDASGGTRILGVTTTSRNAMQMQQPIRATLQLGATEVTAQLLDAGGNPTGTVVHVPWSDFQE